MSKIIHIGAYRRIQDVRIPRTAREAWGVDTDLEKQPAIRPLWKDWAAGLALLAIFYLVVMAAGFLQSLYVSSHAQGSAVAIECQAEGGNCQ